MASERNDLRKKGWNGQLRRMSTPGVVAVTSLKGLKEEKKEKGVEGVVTGTQVAKFEMSFRE